MYLQDPRYLSKKNSDPNILKLKPTCLQLYFFLNIREAFRLIL